jgi:hypothetical protein
MNKLAQLGPILKESLPGAANKLGVNIYQVMGGLILGAAAMTMISGGRIQIQSLTGPIIIEAGTSEKVKVRSANARPIKGNRLEQGIAAVCAESPLLGTSFTILTPAKDDAIKFSALKYRPCSMDEVDKEVIYLHADDMRKIFSDLIVDETRKVEAHIIYTEPTTPFFT